MKYQAESRLTIPRTACLRPVLSPPPHAHTQTFIIFDADASINKRHTHDLDVELTISPPLHRHHHPAAADIGLFDFEGAKIMSTQFTRYYK